MSNPAFLREYGTSSEDGQIPKLVVAGSIPVARSNLLVGESNSDYHADKKHLSATTVKDWITCPAYFNRRHIQCVESPFSSSSMERGTLVHTALEIGRDECERRIQVVPTEHRTQTGISTSKKSREWLAEQDPDILWVSPQDGDFVGEVWKQLEQNSAALEVYESLQHKECSIRWERQNGIKLKCRPDGITADGICVDYKTCRFPNPLKQFWTNVRDYKYGLQSVLYSEGCASVGFSDAPLLFVLISTVSPYAIQVVRLPQKALVQGRRQLERALNDIQAHQVLKYDYLPHGYGEVHTLEMPDFCFKED